jgi:PAS domain S-box-containing protein
MTRAIRVLILEDNPNDVELMLYELRRNDFAAESVHVDNEQDYLSQLESGEPDLILSDYTLPQLNALRALQLLQETGRDIPFIVVTGSISEEVAVACMQQGAADYVIKDRMARLGQAIIGALERKKVRDEKARAEESLRRANRAYRMLSECNRAVIRARDENELLHWVCEIIVRTGGYRLAWVGYADSSEEQRIRIAAQYGLGSGMIEGINGSGVDVDKGRGSAVRAIRTNETVVAQNLRAAAPTNEDEPSKRSYASMIAMPLRRESQAMGALNVYSDEPNHFGEEDIELLAQLADDLAYGIVALQTRAAREQAEEHIRYQANLLENVSDAVISTDMNFVIRTWNKPAERIYGWTEEEVIGRPLREVLQTETVGETTQEVTRGFLQRGFWHGEAVQRRKDGTPVYILAATTLLTDKAGNPTGAVSINRDITERKAMEEEVLKAERMRVELEAQREVLELKENFISMVSHQFRTPLTVILSSDELLEKYYERLTPEKRTKYLVQIREQTQYMSALLDEVLFISKAKAGKLDFEPTEMDLEAFCRSAFEQLQFTDNGAHRFVFEASGDFKQVRADPKLLQHIVFNLLSNAIKYTPEGREIRFTLQREDENAVLRFADEGLGIPEKDQERLFEPFHRAGNVRQMRGTGLGLAIVKDSVLAHGGRIAFESQEGVGTTFTVWLPV